MTTDTPPPGSPEAAIEIFVPVRGFEGLYEISNLGKVKSLRYYGYQGKEGILKPRWTPVKKGKNNGRYASVRLMDFKRSLDEQRSIHRMVAEAFVEGQTPERNEVNHIDGNTENNCANNLEWVSRSENQKHAICNGLAKAPQDCTDSGTKFFWKHCDGRIEYATPAKMSRAHGLDASYAYKMSAKHPHHHSHKGWRIIQTPPPGSPEAVAFSCSCPRMDNGHGKGYMGVPGIYVYSGDCPLHRLKPEPRYINDGFGNEWKLCDKPDCQLAVVRPGKAECQRCDHWTEQDELDRSKHRSDIL